MQPNFTAMPAELRSVPRWVVWKGAKIPFCAMARSSTASVRDPDTWAPFPQTQTAFEEGGYSGVGFVLNGDGIVGVDLDKCVHAGKPDPAALRLLDRVGCHYIEFSPSGTGMRGFGYGEKIAGARGKLGHLNAELYAAGRYLTVTGNTLKAGPLVRLPGFSEVADAVRGSHLQKRPEEDLGNLLSSSVGLFSSVGIPPSTLPASEGERHRCIFELARYFKGTQPHATREELRVIVQAWHALALPVIGTKDFSTTWTDFLRGWDKVKQPYGTIMQTIIEEADLAAPLPAGIAALGYGAPTHRLIRICMAAQAHQGEAPFFLSARQAGLHLAIHFTDASKMLAALVSDGVLVLVSKGAGKVASRYRFAWNQA